MDIKSIPDAFNSGLNGYKKAEQGVAESSAEINRLNTENQPVSDNSEAPAQNAATERPRPSLEAESVNLIVNEHLAKANVKVIKTADEMVGSLIDTKV